MTAQKTSSRYVPGSKPSALRAIEWHRKHKKKAHDKTLIDLECIGRDEHAKPCHCKFQCRGCLHWWPWEDGGSGEGPGDYACSACSNRINVLMAKKVRRN